jgi:hypothetical protein
MSRLINRDPFAREELHRESVVIDIGCSWCGQKRGDKRLYRYFTEQDSGRRSVHRGFFCNIECHNSYHGV